MKAIDGGSVGLQFDDEAKTDVDYDEQSGTYSSEFDLETRTASEAVISTVSQASEIDPMRLPPLFSTVDPDALDMIFVPTFTGSERSDASVTFTYAGHVVTVNSHGTVEVVPMD